MNNQLNQIETEGRNCEVCGSDQLESLWRYERIAKSTSKKWKFDVNNCICQNCGFVFVSPVYKENSLAQYYADARTYYVIDYDIGKRVSILSKYASKKKRYLEIGAKQKTKFHGELTSLFSNVATQGLEDISDCDVSDVDVISNETIDVLAHYFVLEHVPKVKNFLKNCWDLLKFDGVMVVEVPDINKYPSDIAAMMLYEHTNHFSLECLVNLCSQVGFELIESDIDNASRPFGLVGVFRKAHISINRISKFQENYYANKVTFLSGLDVVESYYRKVSKIRQEIYHRLALSEKIIVWAANDISDTLIGQTELLDLITIIDSDPKKINFFENKIVKTPDQASTEISEADFIVICTGQWSKQILKSVKDQFSKDFTNHNIEILDYYFG